VSHAGRDEEERPRAGNDLLVPDREDQLSLQHVEGVVLPGVRVRAGAVAPGLDRDHGEVEPRRVDRPREELDVPDAVALTGPDDDDLLTAHGQALRRG
jgi:hypothetical protein